MGHTFAEKALARAAGLPSAAAGQMVNARPDLVLSHDNAAAIAGIFRSIGLERVAMVAGYRSPILALRRHFDLFANLWPVFSLPVAASRPGVDLLIVRENTEGLYAGRERREGDTAIAERVITAGASERIARAAFDCAVRRRGNGRPASVTIVHKANVLKVTDGLFRERCLAVARDHSAVAVREMLVDAMALALIRTPEPWDVIVTTNLFGDILSDAASGLMGGLGVAPSANLGPRVAVFEPVHGSAPDIAGQGIANPLGAILSAVMLLDHLGEAPAAGRVRRAVWAALEAGVATPDLGGRASTRDVVHRILKGNCSASPPCP